MGTYCRLPPTPLLEWALIEDQRPHRMGAFMGRIHIADGRPLHSWKWAPIEDQRPHGMGAFMGRIHIADGQCEYVNILLGHFTNYRLNLNVKTSNFRGFGASKFQNFPGVQ